MERGCWTLVPMDRPSVPRVRASRSLHPADRPWLKTCVAGLTLHHACEPGAEGAFDVQMAIGVQNHAPLMLGWRVQCD